MDETGKIFFAELFGTFGLLVAATGSVVFDGRMEETLGTLFIAAMHFIGLTILVYVFGKYSMAHFNPAVTLGFLITGHIKTKQLPVYFSAQAIGAILGSLFVKFVIGDFASLGMTFGNYSYSLGLIFAVEILATFFLMTVILIVTHKKSLNKFTGLAVGGIIGIDVILFRIISGASMNPIRSLSPALVAGIYDDLWIYLTAPLVGSAIIALIYKKKILSKTNK
ncbi:MAG TPA: aquaporin [Nitrosopumilaceae archaeon]|nr:aquaporin [Nitrosopumilaceae archaeon]